MIKDIINLEHLDMVVNAIRIAEQIIDDFNDKFKDSDFSLNIYPVPRGGIACAYLTAGYIPTKIKFVNDPTEADIAIDDVIDSGRTKDKILKLNPNLKFYAFYENPTAWLVFPYERTLDEENTSIDDAITRILEYRGKLGEMDFEEAKQCILDVL